MLKLGSSRPWQDAMETLTGQRQVLATPLLNYFEPLRIWLEKKNKENEEFIGWNVTPPVTPSPVQQTSSSDVDAKEITC